MLKLPKTFGAGEIPARPKFEIPKFETEGENSHPLKKPFQLPRLKDRPTFSPCAACGGHIEADSEFLRAARICRKCAGLYAKIDGILNEKAERTALENRLKMMQQKFRF